MFFNVFSTCSCGPALRCSASFFCLPFFLLVFVLKAGWISAWLLARGMDGYQSGSWIDFGVDAEQNILRIWTKIPSEYEYLCRKVFAFSGADSESFFVRNLGKKLSESGPEMIQLLKYFWSETWMIFPQNLSVFFQKVESFFLKNLSYIFSKV